MESTMKCSATNQQYHSPAQAGINQKAQQLNTFNPTQLGKKPKRLLSAVALLSVNTLQLCITFTVCVCVCAECHRGHMHHGMHVKSWPGAGVQEAEPGQLLCL